MSRPEARPHARAEIGLALAGKAGTSFAGIGFASLAPFIRDDLGLSTTFVGGILAMVYLGATLAIIPAGRATDRMPAGRAAGGAAAHLRGQRRVRGAAHPRGGREVHPRNAI